MRVAGEIGEHALGSAERRLGVDDEGAVAQRAHALGEGGGVGERAEFAEEAEFAATEGGLPGRPRNSRRNVLDSALDGQEEVRLAGDPSLAVEWRRRRRGRDNEREDDG